MCAAYAFDDGPPRLWRMGEPIPIGLRQAVQDGWEFHAWNAQFERVMWRDCLARYTYQWESWMPRLEQWHCSMARAALCGLPLGLAASATILKLPEGKDMGGRSLMLRMTKPRTKDPLTWWEEEDKLERLFSYCKNDVLVERGIAALLPPMPAAERETYLLDQRINDRGVRLDVELAAASYDVAKEAIRKADDQLYWITTGQVTGVSKVKALTEWVCQQGVQVDSLDKQSLAVLAECDLPPDVSEALTLRAESAKSSVAKLETMQAYAAGDGRMRGMLQYAGAATGRWSGRGPQPHNFPRGTVENPEQYLPWVRERRLEDLALFAPPMEILSSLMRAHFIPAPGRIYLCADYAAIEARVLAWLARQNDLVAKFEKGVDVYKDLASKIYNTPILEVSSKQRFVGKTATLGLGYQMGPPRFAAQCAAMGVEISEEFALLVVRTYRESNPCIKALWNGLAGAAIDTVATKVAHSYNGITFAIEGNWLTMRLPSGRCLYYSDPRLHEVEAPWTDENGKPVMQSQVVVNSYSTMTRIWGPRRMYGGLWTENAVQAIARDLLAHSMLQVERAGFPVVLTVHDEILSEVTRDARPAEVEKQFAEVMRRVPEWAAGCPVGVETWRGERYRK
jgi:DNA polymerase